MKRARALSLAAAGAALAPAVLFAAPAAQASGTQDLPREVLPCPRDENNRDPENKVAVAVEGVPDRIVAGDGWHEVTLRLTNTSDAPIEDVGWRLGADNGEGMSQDWLGTYTDTQLKVADGWRPGAHGMHADETDLAARQTVDVRLRVSVNAQAPTGRGWLFASAWYLNAEKNCNHGFDTYDQYDFQVLPPAQGGGQQPSPTASATPSPTASASPTATAKPSPSASATGTPSASASPSPTATASATASATAAPAPQPHGGTPAGGALADTGPSSALGAAGLAGGAALAAGGGLVLAVRRRARGGAAGA